MIGESDSNPIFSLDTSGKFLFMRHGETFFNREKYFYSRGNPEFCDSHLSDDGINQIKLSQETINKLNIEKVFVSPYYRTLQTVTIALENYPNLKDITVVVHPKLAEVVCGAQEFIVDIKQNKKDFNMDSKVKIDWSYFEKYIQDIKFDENFFYFENIDSFDEKEIYDEYAYLKKIYDENDSKGSLKEELGKFLKSKNKKCSKYESSKHSYERFENLMNFLTNEFKDTINDTNKKVLCVSHSSFIKAGIDSKQKAMKKQSKKHHKQFQIKNGEIVSLFV